MQPDARQCVPGITMTDIYVSTNAPGKRHITCLHQSIFPQQRTGQGWGSSQEARVRHFFHSLSDWQHQCGVNEGHNDVGVKLICEMEAGR